MPVVVCTLAHVALETIVASTAIILVHSVVGRLGGTFGDSSAARSSVVVGLCFVHLLLLLRCTLVRCNPLRPGPFLHLFPLSFTVCLSFDRCVS